MKHSSSVLSILMFLAGACFGQSDHSAKQSGHIMVTPGQTRWQTAGPPLPPGAQVSVLSGDPSQSGKHYTISLKMPNGYRLPPHWHPMDASVVVVKGVFVMGLGETFDKTKGSELTPGSFMLMPQGVRHFEWTKGETIIYVYGVGPLDTIYVNSADDRRSASK